MGKRRENRLRRRRIIGYVCISHEIRSLGVPDAEMSIPSDAIGRILPGSSCRSHRGINFGCSEVLVLH
jgi:hypothetical protein